MSLKHLLAISTLVIALAAASFADVLEWWSQDIGTIGGSAEDDPASGSFTVTADGADIWGTSDQFHFVFKQLHGDGEIAARMVSVGTGSNRWAKAGVMMRETIDPDSKHAMMVATGGEGGGAAFQWRPDTGAESSSVHDPSAWVSPPVGMALVRKGNQISGWFKFDDGEWILQGFTDIVMADPILIGLCATSHAQGEYRTFVFNPVEYVGDVTGRPQDVAAYDPSPADGAVDVPTEVTLTWSAGAGALWHEVYFGTHPDALEPIAGTEWDEKTVDVDLEPGTTYYWQVDEGQVDGTALSSEVWTFTTQELEIGPPGLRGEYFHWSGEAPPAREALADAVLTRIDPQIDFAWDDGSPGPFVGADRFAVRWTGWLEIPESGTYTLMSTTDDGVRVWLDSQLIIGAWWDQAATQHTSRPLDLAAGPHPIQVEYYESYWGAISQLSWQGPSTPMQPIPSWAFFQPGDGPGFPEAPLPVVPTSLVDQPPSEVSGFLIRSIKAPYADAWGYDAMNELLDFGSLAGISGFEEGSRIDPVVNLYDSGSRGAFDDWTGYPDATFPGIDPFEWRASEPGAGDDDDYFATRVTGWAHLTEGRHTIGVNSDDGAIVEVGGIEIGRTEELKTTSNRDFPFEILREGYYYVEVSNLEGAGGASLELHEVPPDDGRLLMGDAEGCGSTMTAPPETPPDQMSPITISGKGTLRRARKKPDGGGVKNRPHIYLWFEPAADSPCKQYEWYQYVKSEIYVDTAGNGQWINRTNSLNPRTYEPTATGLSVCFGRWSEDWQFSDWKSQGRPSLPRWRPKGGKIEGQEVSAAKPRPYTSTAIPGTAGQEGLHDAPNWAEVPPQPPQGRPRVPSPMEIVWRRQGRITEPIPQSPGPGSDRVELRFHFRSYLVCVKPKPYVCLGYVSWTYRIRATIRYEWEEARDVGNMMNSSRYRRYRPTPTEIENVQHFLDIGGWTPGDC